MKKEGKEMTGGTSSSSSILPNSSVAMSSSGTGGERASPSLSVLDPSTVISTNVNAKDSADKLHVPSSSSSSSKKSKPPKAELPSWIFDLEEYDDIEEDGSRTLFEELEIDPTHIYKNVIWMLVSPFNRILGRPYYKRHPLYTSSYHRQNIDFWGPCAMVSLYNLVLWFGHVKEVVWIYMMWCTAALFNHFITRVPYPTSSIMIHVALLGYSVVPMIPFVIVMLLVDPPAWIGSILQVIAIIWATSSAILSYNAILVTTSIESKARISLLYPVVILMQLYLTSLIPFHRRD